MEEVNFYSTVSLLEEDLIHSFLLENDPQFCGLWYQGSQLQFCNLLDTIIL